MSDTRDTVQLAANLTQAWLNNPNVRATGDEVATFLRDIHGTLAGLGNNGSPAAENMGMAAGAAAEAPAEPAVTVRKSLASKDKIISLIDGKPYSSLKRHLSSHGMTPAQYRERYGLKPDYPMVAPAYAEKRRQLAKKIGLGVKTGRKAKQAVSTRTAATQKRGRPAKPKTPAAS